MHKARPTTSASDKKRFLAIISESFAEMDRLREIMKEDDIKIAASFARTQAIIDEIKAMRAADEREA
jgi:hypothetical protein